LSHALRNGAEGNAILGRRRGDRVDRGHGAGGGAAPPPRSVSSRGAADWRTALGADGNREASFSQIGEAAQFLRSISSPTAWHGTWTEEAYGGAHAMLKIAVGFVVILMLAPCAHAMSGMQMARDGHRVMVSKNVGDERWAIIYDSDDHTAMGNVFFPSGGPPAFVWCMETGDDGNPDRRAMQMAFACYGADPCPAEPCSSEDWHFIDDVMLPGGFFMAPQMSMPHMGMPGAD
jgi:hypothetical protein